MQYNILIGISYRVQCLKIAFKIHVVSLDNPRILQKVETRQLTVTTFEIFKEKMNNRSDKAEWWTL